MLDDYSGATRLFPLIGDPIAFVKSVHRLTQGFEGRSFDGICVPMQVPLGQLDTVMKALSAMPNVDGILVTMPHKFDAFRHCATSSRRARLLGVVSLMRRTADGGWHGEMLDGLAFVKAQRDQGARHQGARALLVGAGGAGSAVAQALLEAGVTELIINDTDPARVARLIDLLHDPGGRVRFGPADPTGCDIVANATPLGLAADDPLPVPAELLTNSMFVGDVIAGHGETPLLAAARAAGAGTSDGVQMVEAAQELMLDFFTRG